MGLAGLLRVGDDRVGDAPTGRAEADAVAPGLRAEADAVAPELRLGLRPGCDCEPSHDVLF